MPKKSKSSNKLTKSKKLVSKGVAAHKSPHSKDSHTKKYFLLGLVIVALFFAALSVKSFFEPVDINAVTEDNGRTTTTNRKVNPSCSASKERSCAKIGKKCSPTIIGGKCIELTPKEKCEDKEALGFSWTIVNGKWGCRKNIKVPTCEKLPGYECQNTQGCKWHDAVIRKGKQKCEIDECDSKYSAALGCYLSDKVQRYIWAEVCQEDESLPLEKCTSLGYKVVKIKKPVPGAGCTGEFEINVLVEVGKCVPIR